MANICLNSYTSTKFYPFIESEKELSSQLREAMVGGPSIVFTQKAAVDDIHIRESKNLCESIYGIDSSQLYPYSMCQQVPTGQYTRCEFDANLQRFQPRQSKPKIFEIWSHHIFSKGDQTAELRALTQ